MLLILLFLQAESDRNLHHLIFVHRIVVVLFIVDMQARLALAMAGAEAILARTRILLELDLTLAQWWDRLFDAGLAFPTWPVGLGGSGATGATARAVTAALVSPASTVTIVVSGAYSSRENVRV